METVYALLAPCEGNAQGHRWIPITNVMRMFIFSVLLSQTNQHTNIVHGMTVISPACADNMPLNLAIATASCLVYSIR